MTKEKSTHVFKTSLPAFETFGSNLLCKTNPIPLAVTVYDRRTPRAKFCHYIHHNLDSVTLPFSPTADAGEPEIVEKINGKSKVIYYWAFGHLLGICLFNLDIFN